MMKLVLASGNKGKLREFQAMMGDTPIVPFGELMEPFEIVEDGNTFAANALIKARAVYEGLNRVQGSEFRVQDDKQIIHQEGQVIYDSLLQVKTQNTRPLTTPDVGRGVPTPTNDYIVIADDSGISVPALGGEPGIYSARYAGESASDKDNLYKLIDVLKARAIKRTPAYYTAAIAIVSKHGEYVVHGWMYGDVIDEARGDKGFGYDPMFVPNVGRGVPTPTKDKTLGELDDDVKSAISHRAKALELAKPIIDMLKSK